MSTRSKQRASSAHPFFRAMVTMGSSLTIGCGGSTTDTGGIPDARGDSGAGGGASGGGGGGGLGASAPGGFRSGSGGLVLMTGSGETILVPGGAGGTMASGGAGAGGVPLPEPRPLPCPPGQWVCSTGGLVCAGGNVDGYLIPNDCGCDTARPATADACPNGEERVCRTGIATAGATTQTPPILFDCTCKPHADACGTECAAAFPGPGLMNCTARVSPGGRRDVLCGCAYVTLQ